MRWRHDVTSSHKLKINNISELSDLKNHRHKKRINFLAHLETEIGKSGFVTSWHDVMTTWRHDVMTTWPSFCLELPAYLTAVSVLQIARATNPQATDSGCRGDTVTGSSRLQTGPEHLRPSPRTDNLHRKWFPKESEDRCRPSWPDCCLWHCLAHWSPCEASKGLAFLGGGSGCIHGARSENSGAHRRRC